MCITTPLTSTSIFSFYPQIFIANNRLVRSNMPTNETTPQYWNLDTGGVRSNMPTNETTAQYWNLDTGGVWSALVPETDSNESGVATGTPQGISPLVNPHIFLLFSLVIDLLLKNVVSLFGCCSNIVNIVVYLNMGLADTTTINILALSVVDLLACATTVISMITLSPFTAGWTLPSGAPVRELAFAAFIVYYLSVTCSAWVTALLSVERCLCIVVPLKVGSVNTKGNKLTLYFPKLFFRKL